MRRNIVATKSGEVHILSDRHDRPLKLLERLLWRPTRTASEVIASTKKIPKSALSMHAKARLTPMADIEERGMSLLIPLVIEDITVVVFFRPCGRRRTKEPRHEEDSLVVTGWGQALRTLAGKLFMCPSRPSRSCHPYIWRETVHVELYHTFVLRMNRVLWGPGFSVTDKTLRGGYRYGMGNPW